MTPIGTAAERSGVSIETFRYYVREGIIAPIGRTASGRRVFSNDEIGELRFIKRCRDLGFSISDARALRAFSATPTQARGEVEKMARAQLLRWRARLPHVTCPDGRVGTLACPQ